MGMYSENAMGAAVLVRFHIIAGGAWMILETSAQATTFFVGAVQ